MNSKLKNREDSKLEWIAKAMNTPVVHKEMCETCGRELPGITDIVKGKFECLWCIGDKMFKDLPPKPRLDLEDFCRIQENTMSNETAGCLSLILTIIFVVVGVYTFDYITCKTKSDKQGMECSWGPIQRCMVKTENGWMDYERLRYIKEEQ